MKVFLIFALLVFTGCKTVKKHEGSEINNTGTDVTFKNPKETIETLKDRILEIHSRMPQKAENPDLTGYSSKCSHAVKYTYYSDLMMVPGPEPLKKRFNYWKTFFYKNGRLCYTKEHPAGEGKKEFLADAVKYNEKNKPFARLIYRNSGSFEYAIYVLYKHDLAILSCRVYPGNKIKFIKFHNNFKPEE